MYPISLNIKGKLCVVIGGGNVAERKVLSLLKAHACVRIISPQLTLMLSELAANNALDWRNRGYQTGDLEGALLIFAATNNRKIQESVVRDAEQTGQLINVADAPDLCDFQVPAVVQRENLNLTVSTNGASPALAAKIRLELEEKYGEEYAILLRLMSRIRKQLCKDSSSTYTERKIVFQNILHEDIIHWIRGEQWEQLSQHLKTVLGPNTHFNLLELIEKEIKSS
ncbi:MAG: bifunctional precorrin-2 dehydrogenase/sirohydrochlorin ferrochelatase [Candidatus Electrothrix scaldis]|nr:MAG: bifunctional precorrin-2 dehydrogenase/sirohydrochlorin ferrochelatase [Candidatus Electrothrix sp. GW3-3]